MPCTNIKPAYNKISGLQNMIGVHKYIIHQSICNHFFFVISYPKVYSYWVSHMAYYKGGSNNINKMLILIKRIKHPKGIAMRCCLEL